MFYNPSFESFEGFHLLIYIFEVTASPNYKVNKGEKMNPNTATNFEILILL